MKKKPIILEKDLQALFVDFLEVHRKRGSLLYCSVPNGANRNARFAAAMKRQGLVAGAADVMIFFSRGRTVMAEIKRPLVGKQSPAQIQFEAEAKALGHEYVVFDDFFKFQAFVIEKLKN